MLYSTKSGSPLTSSTIARRPAVGARALAALVLAFVLSALLPAHAFADVCSALQAQLPSGSGAKARSPEVAQLTRQLAAIGALQRQRKCGAGSGGFFSACGDLAGRKAEIQRKISSATRSGALFGSGNASGIRARLAALGCSDRPAAPKRDKFATWEHGTRLPGGNTMLFCVRLSDGYFFPTPNSQFVGKDDDYKNTLDRCQYICNDRAMDIYALGDIGMETEEMLSVDTRKPYKDLSTAFAYREAADFKGCETDRYYRRVDEARARTVTPADLSNAIIPMPKARPAPQPEGLPSSLTAYAPEEAVPLDPTRKVRVIGEPFLPDQPSTQ